MRLRFLRSCLIKELIIPGFILPFACFSQTSPSHDSRTPIYHVTVIDRTITAVNYQYRNGPTQIDFKGTVLLPQAKGEAIVESKTGRTDIDAKFQHLETPARFGPEYLTYVLWAITPEGRAKNLGEVIANGSDKAHLRVTTELQAFGLIITAEPYSSVRSPSDVVVSENVVRPDTIGSTEPIRATAELLPRGTYTYYVSDPAAFNKGPMVSMGKYEQIVEIYQAQNAVQIAQAQGADRYAAELLAKAAQELNNARQLESIHAGRSQVVTAARKAGETAEDARALTMEREREAELTKVQDQAAQERKLREAAEARAQADRTALETERSQRTEATPESASPSTEPPPPPPSPQAYAAPQTYARPPVSPGGVQTGRNQRRTATRAAFLQQLRGTLAGSAEILDAPRGVIVIVRDSDFRGAMLNKSIASFIARIPSVVTATPGLAIEVDGFTDVSGVEREAVAEQRAQQVRDALTRGGLLGRNAIVARGMGSGHPLGSNATASGREQNRRVEIVISGDAIGNLPLWDKIYDLSLRN
jgi:flagellar motor protein MotB